METDTISTLCLHGGDFTSPSSFLHTPLISSEEASSEIWGIHPSAAISNPRYMWSQSCADSNQFGWTNKRPVHCPQSKKELFSQPHITPNVTNVPTFLFSHLARLPAKSIIPSLVNQPLPNPTVITTTSISLVLPNRVQYTTANHHDSFVLFSFPSWFSFVDLRGWRGCLCWEGNLHI